MKDVQELFDEIQVFKKEQKEIRKEYKNTLMSTNDYEEILEEAKVLREKKKQIESRVQSEMGTRYDELEALKTKIEEHNQMISDVAMTSIAEGKNINVTDNYNNLYEPSYKVTFKKAS